MKKQYYIVEHSGIVSEIIDKSGKPNKYGEPKIFDSLGKAVTWCDKHSYGGMTHYYEVKEYKE